MRVGTTSFATICSKIAVFFRASILYTVNYIVYIILCPCILEFAFESTVFVAFSSVGIAELELLVTHEVLGRLFKVFASPFKTFEIE